MALDPGEIAYELDEIAKHNTAKSLWLIIDQQVYDVTSYHKRHPGGAAVMLQWAGKDATIPAAAAHQDSAKPAKVMQQFLIGTVADNSRRSAPKEGPRKKNAFDTVDDPAYQRQVSPFEDETPKAAVALAAQSIGERSNIYDSVVADCEEVSSGEEALIATADLLYQRLRMDKRLLRYMNGNNNLRGLAAALRNFLAAGAFSGSLWPEMRIRDDLVASCVTDMADVLADILGNPLPLGEDPLVAAVQLLGSERHRNDERIVRFFEHIMSMKEDTSQAEEPETPSPPSAPESRETTPRQSSPPRGQVNLPAAVSSSPKEQKSAPASAAPKSIAAQLAAAKSAAPAPAPSPAPAPAPSPAAPTPAAAKSAASPPAAGKSSTPQPAAGKRAASPKAKQSSAAAAKSKQDPPASSASSAAAASTEAKPKSKTTPAPSGPAPSSAAMPEPQPDPYPESPETSPPASSRTSKRRETASQMSQSPVASPPSSTRASKQEQPKAKSPVPTPPGSSRSLQHEQQEPDAVDAVLSPEATPRTSARSARSARSLARSSSGPQLPKEEQVVDVPSSEQVGKLLAETETLEAETNELTRAASAGHDIDTEHFDELKLAPDVCSASKDAWQLFLARNDSIQAAGEAIFSAIFENAKHLQTLFKTSKAVQAIKLMNSLNSFMGVLENPSKLKTLIETIGFAHLHIEVTAQAAAVFRDAIMDLMALELGDRFSETAQEGWRALLNYVGGAIIYVKTNYAGRIETLISSWKIANGKKDDKFDQDSSGGSDGDSQSSPTGGKIMGMHEHGKKKSSWFSFGGKNKTSHTNEQGDILENGNSHLSNKSNSFDSLSTTFIPTTFHDMFLFNAAVMGFGSNFWMQDVLLAFPDIVTNVDKSSRLQEECRMLALRISSYAQSGQVRLVDYKACMLASLRSLLPKDWSTAHEVAWTWLWDNVEHLLEANMYDPPKFQQRLTKFIDSVDEVRKYELRMQVYATFFIAAPVGQDYFKQSNTRLHFIADKVLEMVVEIFQEPTRLASDIGALGLRHVGYAIPTDLFGPFVTAFIEVMGNYTTDQVTLDAFRWSLGLVQQILVRTIEEGSTLVMKAVNNNSSKLVTKAISAAPRGSRATWMLSVQVGVHEISPLMWGIESGNLVAAQAIIQDLMVIRADRESYYYGMEDLFKYHPDCIDRLTVDAPTLLPTLFEGLVWRCRHTKNGMRRVNYYVKYFIVDREGKVSGALSALVASQDPKIMSDCVVVMVSDVLWRGIVSRLFIKRKAWFLLSLFVLMLSQAILPNLEASKEDRHVLNQVTLGLRCLNYGLTMPDLLYRRGKVMFDDYREGNVMKVCRIPLPRCLEDKVIMANVFLLTLIIIMCSIEPFWYCTSHPDWPTEFCDASMNESYHIVGMAAMLTHWFLMTDMAVFSTGLSAFALVCSHVMSEISRFLAALFFVLMTFATAMSALRHYHEQFRDVGNCAMTLFAITVARYEGDYREINDEPLLLACVFIFVLASGVLLMNLLIAQLNCTYEFVYADMLGYARLQRASCIVEMLESVAARRWEKFVGGLGLDKPLEFGEGDLGIAGGIGSFEPASLHPTTEDTIHRYGGSCSPDMRWPDDVNTLNQDQDKYARLEKMIHKIMKRSVRSAQSKGASAENTFNESKGSKGSKGTQSQSGSEMSD